MESQLEKDGLFTFSDTPSSIYDYQCFDDQSSKEPITGHEFQKNEHNWNYQQKQIWHYFNRPYNYGYRIGGKQKQEIKIKEELIISKSGDRSLLRIAKYLSFIILGTTILYSFFQGSWGLVIVSTVFALITLFKLGDINNQITQASKVKQRYQDELNHLLAQHDEILDNMLSQRKVLKIFWEKVAALEAQLHSQYFPGTPKYSSSDFYSRLNSDLKTLNERSLDHHPLNPVVLSWGLLQPSSRSFEDKRQATGMKAAAKDIKEKIAVFRYMTDGTPLYRLLYVQFLFFKERNLNVISLSYDFLTEVDYNISVDTYQYNHITGTSYSEEDISYMHEQGTLEELGVSLSEQLLKRVYGSQVKVISFSSTSGNSFRCVLPDKKVTKGLADWLFYKQQSLTTEEVLSQEGVESEGQYLNKLNKKTAENIVLNKLAECSVKELWERCNKSIALTEHGYMKDIAEERKKIRKERAGYRGRQPFTGQSKPRPSSVDS